MAKVITCEITKPHGFSGSTLATSAVIDLSCGYPYEFLAALDALDADYQTVRKTLQVNKVRQFKDEVAGLAVHHEASAMQDWITALSAALASFNITQIKGEMIRYKEIVSAYRQEHAGKSLDI